MYVRHIRLYDLYALSHMYQLIKLIEFVKGERQGWLEISDVITVRIFPIWYSSPFFLSVCSVSVCMFKILVQGSCFYH